MQSQSDNASLIVTIASKVMPFDPGEVMPGIRAVPLSGHTRGHSGGEIASNGRKPLDMSNMAYRWQPEKRSDRQEAVVTARRCYVAAA